MVSKQTRCLALISHNNMKPAMQARLQDLYSYTVRPYTLCRPRTSMQLVTQNACACGWSAPLCLFTHTLYTTLLPLNLT